MKKRTPVNASASGNHDKETSHAIWPTPQIVIFVQIVLMVTCVATAGELAAQPKTPVPDVQAQQTAKKAAGELFAERFTQAKTTAEKTALATNMMDAAGKVQAGSADQ